MNNKIICEACNIEINEAFIKKHNKTKSHVRNVENDILIITINNGKHKTKNEWIENFESIGVIVPNYVKNYGNELIEDTTTAEQRYYKKNKEKILNKNKELVKCECGKSVKKNSMFKHKQSKKHKKFLELNN